MDQTALASALAPASQGWEAYSYLLVASFMGLFAPFCLALASRILRRSGRGRGGQAMDESPELDEAHIRERARSQSTLGARFNTRIHVGVNLAISFFGVILLLLPWVLEIRGQDARVFALVLATAALLALC